MGETFQKLSFFVLEQPKNFFIEKNSKKILSQRSVKPLAIRLNTEPQLFKLAREPHSKFLFCRLGHSKTDLNEILIRDLHDDFLMQKVKNLLFLLKQTENSILL